MKVLNRYEVAEMVTKKLGADLRGLSQIPDPEKRRQELIELLNSALDSVLTIREYTIDFLSTVEDGLNDFAKEGETCAEFLERTKKTIAEWEASA